MKITIIRTTKFPDSQGVFGSFLVDGEPFSKFVENGDDLIPVGQYVLVPHDTTKHPDVVAFVNPALNVYHELGDAPSSGGPANRIRTACLIHVANFPDELQGCVAPGDKIVRFAGRGWGVSSSTRTMMKLQDVWGDRSNLTAEIIEQWE